MSAVTEPIRVVVAHLDAASQGRSGRRAMATWVLSNPELGEWATPAELAGAIRSAKGAGQDRLVGLVLGVAGDDELAQLTLVAGLSVRMAQVVAGWRRSVDASELELMSTDLVSATWMVVAQLAGAVAAGAGIPARVAWHIMDEAREQVRVPRRRERRASALRTPLDEAVGDPEEASSGERLTGVLVDAVRDGTLTRGAAASVYMTRVAGWGVAETAACLGRAEVSVRVARLRAERRLAAA